MDQKRAPLWVSPDERRDDRLGLPSRDRHILRARDATSCRRPACILGIGKNDVPANRQRRSGTSLDRGSAPRSIEERQNDLGCDPLRGRLRDSCSRFQKGVCTQEGVMGRETGIAWTDETWNPIRGCSRVSEGCRNCYAERVAARFSGPGMPYEGLAYSLRHETKAPGLPAQYDFTEPRWTGEVRFIEERLADPLCWKRP